MTAPAPLAERIGEVLALDEKRTPGEWHVEGRGGIKMDGIRDSYAVCTAVGYVASMQSKDRLLRRPDASFIAAAPTMADLLRESLAENELLERSLRNVLGCFDAAECEGLSDRLSELPNEVGTIRDLVERRLMFARQFAELALTKDQTNERQD